MSVSVSACQQFIHSAASPLTVAFLLVEVYSRIVYFGLVSRNHFRGIEHCVKYFTFIFHCVLCTLGWRDFELCFFIRLRNYAYLPFSVLQFVSNVNNTHITILYT